MTDVIERMAEAAMAADGWMISREDATAMMRAAYAVAREAVLEECLRAVKEEACGACNAKGDWDDVINALKDQLSVP